ncbi:MAG: hypothetical protein IKW81_10255 [Pseudobutyrivibrio sp.]|nr:hypothetical protein [Pseudobutyrivibrio sp.]
MNYYDKKSFDINSLDDESAGIKFAKRLFLYSKIALFYVIAFLFFCFYYIRQRYDFYLEDEYVFFWLASAFFLYIFLSSSIKLLFIKYSGLKQQSFQEKIHFGLYLYYKHYRYIRAYGINMLLSLAMLEARKGDKEQCRNAVNALPKRFHNSNLDILKDWLDSDSDVIDIKKFKKPNKLFLLCNNLYYLFLSYGLFFFGFDSDMLFLGGLSTTMIHMSQIILAVSVAIAFIFVIYKIIARKQGKYFRAFILVALIIIFGFLSCFIYVPSFRDLVTEKDDEKENSYNSDDYSYNYDYDYYDDYSDDDYHIDNSSEPYDDIDIMNMMIILEGYLKKNGIIEDYYTNFLISYTAKGNVRGTVYRDENYEYNLYDNGLKKDENGNDCLEVVLEAEPLDENGISLGQAEASLKGFYLINIETHEIIDEHKTHW